MLPGPQPQSLIYLGTVFCCGGVLSLQKRAFFLLRREHEDCIFAARLRELGEGVRLCEYVGEQACFLHT